MFLDLNNVVSWLLAYRYAILFPILIVEGPIITIIAGFLSSQGIFNIWVVYGVAIIGDVAGDIIYYAIGRWGGRSLIERWGRFFGLGIEKINNLEKHFADHSGKTLIFGKLSHAIGAPILAAAGVVKMPFNKFVWINFWATLPKSLLLLIIGYYFGEAYKQINQYLNYTTAWILAIIILLIALYYLMVKIGRKIEKD